MEEIEILDFDDQEPDILDLYGEDITAKSYITDPAIAREEEIKRLTMILLTPEKSALLVGKPGIGKTAIVEGLAYLIQKNAVPNTIQGYRIVKLNSTSLIGKINVSGKEELVISVLVRQIKKLSKTILFIDEIHTLMGTKDGNPMDLANILKPALDRGDIKVIGATTTIEYDTYIIRDRAFLRRFEKIEIGEPTEATTVKILMGSLPKIEKQTGIKMRYNDYVNSLLMESIVSATSEFKRIYGLSAMYPDIAFSVLTAAFSEALFQNKNEVDIVDVYNAIKNSKRIYPDSIIKELEAFRKKFAKFCIEQQVELPVVTIDEIKGESDLY